MANIPYGRGVRKVSERLLQDGRALVYTEEDAGKVDFSEIPDGAIKVNKDQGTIEVKIAGQSSWSPANLNNDGTLCIAKDNLIGVETFTITSTDCGNNEFRYLNSEGQARRMPKTAEGGYVFELEKGSYQKVRSHLEVVIDDVLHRDAASGGLIELTEKRFELREALAPEMKITAKYARLVKVGNPMPRIFISDTRPEAAEVGDIWIDTSDDAEDTGEMTPDERKTLVSFDNIIGKPADLAGYGITDDVAYNGHTHSYRDILDFPVVLPASGGHADYATQAEEAKHAAKADLATTADTAKNADYAVEALRAATATEAVNCKYAARADFAVRTELISKTTHADYAATCGHATTADRAAEANHVVKADKCDTAEYAVKARNTDHATVADKATDASHAINADHASMADKASVADKAVNADHATIANRCASADTATVATTSKSCTGNATTASRADKANNADYASKAGWADKAEMANRATIADSTPKATNANHAVNADTASTALTCIGNSASASEAVHATRADTAINATNAENAETAKEAIHAQNADMATNAKKAEKAVDTETLNGRTTGLGASQIPYLMNNGKISPSNLCAHKHAYSDIVGGIYSRGMIIMWYGNETAVPSGWKICDGQNGTPDLRDRFIVGAGRNYGNGATGGADSVQLNKANLPPLGKGKFSANAFNGDYWDTKGLVTTEGHYKALTAGINSEGGSNYEIDLDTGLKATPVENRPPYFALYYIMYTG